jgi:hypothetical protein
MFEFKMKKVQKKIVLVSKSGYSPAHDALLCSLIDRKIELFCTVGKDCRKWEDVMDVLGVLNVRHEFGAQLSEVHSSPQEIPCGSHLSRVDVGYGNHSSS